MAKHGGKKVKGQVIFFFCVLTLYLSPIHFLLLFKFLFGYRRVAKGAGVPAVQSGKSQPI